MSYSQSWFDILNEVTNFQQNKANTWFRGQSEHDYELNSGLYRRSFDKNNVYMATEKAYYRMFERMGHLYHNEKDWNLLFIMQHHGVKTRLLDWTESFATALYFAFLEWKPKIKDCAIWILDPLKLNKLVLKEEIFYLPTKPYEEFLNDKSFYENSLAVYPLRNSIRISSQQGMFTLQGTVTTPLEKEYNGTLFEKDILKKVILTENVYEDVKLYLKHSGISHFSVFPDLDGLAQYVNSKDYYRERE